MPIQDRCKIWCADKMVVGRWYKLVCFEVGHGVPWNYTYNFTCDADNVFLAYDTIYIKSPGHFTINVEDVYGHTDSKEIEAIELIKPDYETIEIAPESWSNLRSIVENATSEGNKILKFKKGEYSFALEESPIDLTNGVVVDFNDSTLNISIAADITTYSGFRILGDFCGVMNAYARGVDGRHDMGSTFIAVLNGKYNEVKNFEFRDMTGFNIGVGTWFNFWTFKPNYQSGRWVDTNNFHGYTGDDGNLVEADDDTDTRWTMNEMQPIIVTADRSYGVGQSSMYIPSGTRMYDIAFYDEEQQFIEIRKDQQFFRKYYYPENAAYIRINSYFDEQPKNNLGRDDYCIMRMAGGTGFLDSYPDAQDTLIDNIHYYNHQTGGMVIVGTCEDTHVNRMFANGNGSVYGWAFDIEDSWNSCMAAVITHSYFGSGIVCLYGSQGVTFMSSICANLQLLWNVHFVSVINSYVTAIKMQELRGYCTMINSYNSSLNDVDQNDAFHSFNPIEKETVDADRAKITSNLQKW